MYIVQCTVIQIADSEKWICHLDNVLNVTWMSLWQILIILDNVQLEPVVAQAVWPKTAGQGLTPTLPMPAAPPYSGPNLRHWHSQYLTRGECPKQKYCHLVQVLLPPGRSPGNEICCESGILRYHGDHCRVWGHVQRSWRCVIRAGNWSQECPDIS